MSENEIAVRTNEAGIRTKRTPELIGREIREWTDTGRRLSLLCGIEIGRRLWEAKELLDHGEWLPWLERETEFTDRSAQRYMKLFDEYGAAQLGLFGPETNTTTLSDLPISKAFALLSIPENERESFAAEVDAEHISVRELQQAIKEKQAAEKRAEEAEKSEGLATKLLEEQDRQLADARKKIEELAKLNSELEKRPVEVAVETVRDEAAIKAAAEDAKKQTAAEYEKAVNDLNAKLLKAEKERDTLKADAAAGGAEAEKKIEAANRETEKIRAELEAARRQLKTSEADVTAFGLHYNYIQTEFSALMAELKKVEARDTETAAKLRAAIPPLLEYFRKEAGAGKTEETDNV